MQKIYWTTQWIMDLAKIDFEEAKLITEIISVEALVWNWSNARDAEVKRAIKTAKGMISDGWTNWARSA
jgi:hypothetical protein